MDRKQFYINVRSNGLFGTLEQSQVDGVEAILNECEAQQVTDQRHIAYILGTIYHEVGGTMQPIEEVGKGHNRSYGHKVWHTGKPYNDIPFLYYGRGYTQNTWRDVYKALTAAAKRAGHTWDFENDPDLLLQEGPSAWASVFAMRTGLYTGVGLSRYFNDKVTDWINARRIVNILDCADAIADYSKKFYQALT